MREISNFKFQISKFEVQAPGVESQLSQAECRASPPESESSVHEVRLSNPGLPIPDLGIPNLGLPDLWIPVLPTPALRIPDSESEISNFRFQIESFKNKIARLSLYPLCFCLCAAALLCGCGYHAVGAASTLPPGLKVIAVPAIENQTSRYRVEQRMTEAVVHEFLARTKYRIVSSESTADAVLHGQITSVEAIPAVFDTSPAPNSSATTTVNTQTARATAMLVSIHMKVWLEERETKQILYRNDNYLFRQPYEISTDPSKMFDEQDPALERMSRDFASRLVADILENF